MSIILFPVYTSGMALYRGQYLDETEAPVTTSSLRKTQTKRTVVVLTVLAVIAGVGYLLWRLLS